MLRLLQPAFFVLSTIFFYLPSQVGFAQPNVVILLVDDAGFMDFGSYGGEANTPHITRLAKEGVQFSNYHTSPLCAPSRAMLLTGLDNHKTGVATIPEVVTREQKDSPAYALRLLPGVKTIADLLKEAGYQTYMTGKWHLGRGDGDLPNHHGFDRSFVLDASGADNWEQKSFMPFYDEAPWFEDGQPAQLPDDFYSSEFLVNKMLEYLGARTNQGPFFAYIGFQAIHIPVQAPREFTDRYDGVYEDGWHATLERRFQNAKELGLISANVTAPRMHPSLREWGSLSAQEKDHYEGNMMVNAGMLEAMDHHIGRLITYLESTGELENTIFVITSDNGPEFGDPPSDVRFRTWMNQNGYHTDLDRLGETGFMGAIGPEWASAASVPGSLFKMYASEGGTRVPLIIRGPGIAPQTFNDARSFVMDVAPTIADLTGSSSAGMDGKSLRPILLGDASEVYAEDEPVGLEVAGNAALFKGRYKMTKNTLPHGDAEWRLHDLQQDPAEAVDLSAQLPEVRAELLADYDRYADIMGVVPLPKDFNIQAQIGANTMNKMLARQMPTFLVAGGVGIALIIGVVLFVRRRRLSQ